MRLGEGSESIRNLDKHQSADSVSLCAYRYLNQSVLPVISTQGMARKVIAGYSVVLVGAKRNLAKTSRCPEPHSCCGQLRRMQGFSMATK